MEKPQAKPPGKPSSTPKIDPPQDKNQKIAHISKYFIEYQYYNKTKDTRHCLRPNCLSSTYQGPTNSYRGRSW